MAQKIKFYKPKAAKDDYTPEMLPKNRKEVFFDVLKLHWTDLLNLGFILLLFSLPLILSQIVQDYSTSSIMQSLSSASTAEEITAAYGKIVASENMRALVNILFLMIYSVGFSGVIRVVRQYAWEMNVNVRSEFLTGVKQNVGQMAATAFVGGLIYAICVFSLNLAAASSGAISWLLYLPIGISLLVVFPILCNTVSSVCVYSNKWRQNLKFGFVIFAKTPFKTQLALLCCVLIFLPQFIPNFYCHVIGRVASSLLTPFALLGWLLFSFNQLDRFVNKEQFPSVVGKGTFKISDKQ